VTTPAPLLGGVSFYRQQARDHSICTIIRTDALLTFTFKDKIHQLTVRQSFFRILMQLFFKLEHILIA
jgi:hypothetical protein